MTDDETVEWLNAHPGWVRDMGIVITSALADEVTCEWEVTERHRQPLGGVHCGVVETLASIGAALAARPRNHHVGGLENNTSFIRAVRAGKRHAMARPPTRGPTTQVWEAWIRDDKEPLVAKGQVRLLCLDENRPLG